MRVQILLSTFLLSSAYAAPFFQQQDPLSLQTKVQEKLTTPKKWSTEIPIETEVETKLANEDPEIVTTDNVVEISPSEAAEMMSWDSRLGNNFRSFMATIKAKHEASRAEEPMVPEGFGSSERGEQGPNGQVNVSWGKKRSVIPKKLGKGKEPTKEKFVEDTPEVTLKAVPEEEVAEVEITSEEFDELFAYYTDKHDASKSKGVQSYLDSILIHKSPYDTARPTLSRREGTSSSSSITRSTWAPAPSRKPTSINPEVFDRIAADYKFKENPMTINAEDGFMSYSSTGKGSNGGALTPLSTQSSNTRGKLNASGSFTRRRF